MKEKKVLKTKQISHSWKKWTALAACAALAIGFVSVFLNWSNSNSDEALLDVVFPKAYAFDDYDTKQAIIDGNPADDTFLMALNEFSYKTAAQLLTDNSGNANYSPLSLYYALAMAASGANGETANELLSLLGVSDPGTLSDQ